MGKKAKTRNIADIFRGPFRSKVRSIRFTSWTLVILLGLSISYLAYSLGFVGKVYPNIYIGNQSFSGLNQQQVKSKITQMVEANIGAEIQLQHAEHTQVFKVEEIEWQVNIEATTDKVMNYGRASDSYLQSFVEQMVAIVTRVKIEPISSFDQEIINSHIDTFADKVDIPALNATGKVEGDKVTTTAENSGELISPDEARQGIISLLNNITGGTVTLERHQQEPAIVLGNLELLNSQVEELSKAKLVLTWPTGKKTLSRTDIRQLIGFTGNTVSGNSKQILSAAFTDDSIKGYLESISSQIDQPAVEPQLIIKDGKLTIVKTSRAGVVMDRSESAPRILSALSSNQENPTVELVMKEAQPTINEANLSSLGIVERIGYGETSFAGSPNNRKHNINNGVSLLSSTLIKPGDEFSTVAKLGAVDASTGFLPELVIKENRTTPEFGGGLCQVSTTLFRSVLNAGLKVTARTNHSYRVGYYEPPVGLDATIYLPKPDLKFLNDTSSHILLQGRVVGNKVIFELWGKSDGRASQVSEPQILSTTPAGEPIYADTDTLPKGEQKQIEKPHDGAVAIAYYTVTRGGQVINKQTFKSIYKPWPARFLVGTNESLPPTTPVP